MVKFLVMDVDGTLTDGKIYMGFQGEMFKAFNVKDGCGIKDILPQYGIIPIIITARYSEFLVNRCKELGITELYQGEKEKLNKLEEIIKNFNIKFSSEYSLKDCAYIGDDILDIECVRKVKKLGGVTGCPNDAIGEIKEIVDYICVQEGGNGAVRDFIEYLIKKDHEVNIENRIKKSINYITKLDLQKIPVGTYYIDENIFYMIQEYETKEIDQCKLESHRKYIDIQWIIKGTEIIDVANISSLEVAEKYDEGKDIIFWKKLKRMQRICLKEGSYVVFYPENAHMPCISAYGANKLVKKMVIKIKIY